MVNYKFKLKKRWSTRIANLTLLFTALAISLLICEFFVRSFYPQRLYFNVSQWDPYVGFSAIPNIEGFSRHQDFTMHIKINSRGLRDREFTFIPPPRTLRIGVFGDSYTFGEGVQNNETFPKILEQLLNRNEDIIQMQRHVEVLNFGIGKTGTSHQLAWYQKEGHKYHLDIVILGFLSANDFADNWGGVFYLKDNQLIHNPTAYSSIRKIQSVVYKIPFYKWLASNSHLVNMARQTATAIDDRMRIDRSAKHKHDSETRKKKTATDADVYGLTLRLIEEFRKETLKDRSRFMVVSLPAKHQKRLSAYSEQDEIKPWIIKGEMLLEDLEQKNIKVLDLVPVFSNLPVSKYYFEHDGHMNKHGHEFVASNIYDAISPDVIRLLPKAARNQFQNNTVQ